MVLKRIITGTGAQSHTVPSGFRETIRACSAYNPTGGGIVCTISLGGAVIESKSIDAGGSHIFMKVLNQTLEAAEAIATAGTGVQFRVSASQESMT
jgi:hypothetical protein